MPVGGPVPALAAPSVDPRLLSGAAWALGIVVTVVIVGTPYLQFGYHSPDLHLVLDSVDSCIALLLAYLLVGRFRRTRRAQDMLLAQGLILLAVAGLGLSLLVTVFGDEARQTLGAWLPVSLRFMAAGLITAAAAARTSSARRLSRPVMAAPLAAALVTVIALWIFRDALPVAVNESATPPASRPSIDGHPMLITVQALGAGCFLVASLGFTAQARQRPDEVLRWLGPACALAGFARLNYVLFPSLYSGWLYTGDLLRTAGYACLLVGATREISRYWSARSQVAVLEDRRRLARELHDGVVQELSWIKSEAQHLPLTQDASTPASLATARAQPIIDACDRALDEARAAVEALGRDLEEPLGHTLHRAALEVAKRYDGGVIVDVDDSVDVEPHHRHELARITREAVGNAFRHGKAQCVHVALGRTVRGCLLRIQDDGAGFDTASVGRASGYGLTSMRERAQGLPGTFVVSSTPGQGTIVEVSW